MEKLTVWQRTIALCWRLVYFRCLGSERSTRVKFKGFEDVYGSCREMEQRRSGSTGQLSREANQLNHHQCRAVVNSVDKEAATMILPNPVEVPDPNIDDPALPEPVPEQDPPPSTPPPNETPVGDPPANAPPVTV